MLVENDPVAAALSARVFQETKAWNQLIHFDDCQRALSHLRSRSEEKPLLILLALEVPGGGVFLETLKTDETLRMIPVVVLAASKETSEVTASFSLGAVGYMIKTTDLTRLSEEVAAIPAYGALSEFPRS